MKKVKKALLNVGRFIGIILLIDLGLFTAVTVSCRIGTQRYGIATCTNLEWSERMFWVGIIVMILAAPAVFAMLSTGKGFSGNPMTAGMDNAIALDIIKSERQGMNKRMVYALRMGLIGAGAIATSALIDILTR